MVKRDADPRAGAAIPFDESPLLPPLSDAERWLYGLSRFGMKPGLGNINALLECFDHPERDLRFLHVAGSNGKGSVCMMLDALLRAAGQRTGLFTSPHLLNVGERLRVDGVPCGESRFSKLLGRVEGAVSELEATFFETMTLIALLHFREVGAEWVLWETGLGGRLDCTRAVDAEAALLCSLSREHTRYLGDSLEEIALEKLAIGRPGKPFYLFRAASEITEIARSEAARTGFRLRETAGLLPWRMEGDMLCVGTSPFDEDARFFRLAGRYARPGLSEVQGDNAALALITLADLGFERGEDLLPADPAAVLAGTALPGRFDLVRRDPPLVLDGAHNPEALAATLSAWRRLLPPEGEDPIVVFACMEDKERPEMLDLLAAHPGRVLFTAVGQGRATPPAWFLTQPQAAGRPWESVADLAAALPEDADRVPLLVTGSFYLAAEAYHLLGIDPWRPAVA
jgi:dihydrofolate synthase/folylpolyglutamate synthase